MENSITIQAKSRGGKRDGAGRKPLDMDARWFRARGISPLKAAEILAHVADERALWRRIFESPDDRIILDALKFLVSMRDGKPAQQINVTSQSVHLDIGDLEKARAIVREIRGDAIRPNLGLAAIPAESGASSGTTVPDATQGPNDSDIPETGK